ncbi:conserved uncharacterized protein [Erwinia sp. Ejp617]|nr:conserved uncharacterized protein [Erwinia sp. Ejp617]
MLLAYVIWVSLRPVEIVAVHKDGNHSSVLVKTFPFTDSGKIEWWLKNRDMLKEKYDTPEPELDGSFTVVFWLLGEGYKEEGKYDRRCFEDMRTQKNCIDKNSLILVKNSKNSGMYYILDSGTYRINDTGEIIKNKSD